MEGEEVVGITMMVTGGTVVAPGGVALPTTIVGGKMDRLSGLSSSCNQGPSLRKTNPQQVTLSEIY